MGRFKISKTIVLVSGLVLFSLALLFFSTQKWFRESRILAPVNYVVSGIDRLLAKPSAYISGLISETGQLLDTYDENRNLKAALSETDSMAAENDSLLAENESLRQALKLTETYGAANSLAAEVLFRNPDTWSESLSIDKGSQHGVTKDSLVVANGGLIGTLSTVDVSSSSVQLLTDQNRTKNLAVKVNLSSGAVYGILTGYDTKKEVFIVSQLNSTAEITKGSQVVTSDLSDKTASNVLVGTVAEVKRNGDTLDMELHVTPAADFSNIYAVVLVGN